MDTITRRRFLIASGVAAVAAGAGTYTLWDILATANDPNRGPDDRTLVVLTLYGGNDGLATVIPFMSRLSGSTRVSTPTDSNRTRSPRQGISPKTVSVASVATNTLPLTTSGMANFAATASVSRVPAWLLLYSSVARFDAS